MFRKILIANRGEIACRIMATARRLGIGTVAVHSTADTHALHVRSADEAWCIGPPPSAQSYLNIDSLLEAARASGAEAIHPGYGFLSENAEFASACAAAGIVFIGPGVEAIRIMGSKREAKILMEAHGVPLVPGYYGAAQEDAVLADAAREVGLPLLIKASAGGGGRGMRIVRDYAEFPAALASAQREAKNAFGDASVLLERYVENPRHIEVQVFGDTHGNLVHLFERDCSLQRRHQKVIEEAPAVLLSDAQRATLFEAAIKAARAVDYVGAGTVEFIIDRKGGIYFIEMNTRLQVEHPVTEEVTGQDLVEWQLRVAAGETLPLTQDEIVCEGHAIEVRVYAEDAAQAFQPSTGEIVHLVLPHEDEQVRVDTGVVAGSSVTPFYDAMVAKIITIGATREEALRSMRQALAGTEIVGITANIPYLQRIIAHPEFEAGGFDTHFVEEARDALHPVAPPLPSSGWALLAAHRLLALQLSGTSWNIAQGDPDSPWGTLPGFRLNQAARDTLRYRQGEIETSCDVVHGREGWQLILNGQPHPLAGMTQTGARLSVTLGTQRVEGSVVVTPRETHVFLGGEHYRLNLINALHTGEDAEEAAGKVVSPMPGAVTALLVAVGDRVTRGTPLLVVEAMKIEHTLTAPFDGVVEEIRFQPGEQVLAEGIELVTLTAAEPAK
jgi:3-methylcrotonyl-CoA carboxylase alpha subunit